MALRNPVGIWFSDLKDNWEKWTFFYDFSMKKDDRHYSVYRRCGDLPDGRHYGVSIFPRATESPEISVVQIVDDAGEMKHNVAAEYGSWKASQDHWPMAVVCSPGGKSIVWIKENELWAWHWDWVEGRFISIDEDPLTPRLDGLNVLDARMHKDGVLELRMENGITMGYLCDADLVLEPRGVSYWIPKQEECGQLSYALKKGLIETVPESLIVLISEEDGWGEYAGCGARQVAFAPGLKRIEGQILADNPGLERVVIPASVEYVEYGAFQNCRNLRDLVIENDPSRAANWNEDAFEGCPCEEEYMLLRGNDHGRE